VRGLKPSLLKISIKVREKSNRVRAVHTWTKPVDNRHQSDSATSVKPTTKQIQGQRQIINQSTSQPTSPGVLPPADPAATFPNLWPKYAVINAHTGRGRDWIALIGISARYGVPLDPPEYWQIYRLKAGRS
jgi:hypothetical protein